MHGWRLTPGKTCLSFKTMKIFKIADPVLTMNSFCDEDYILQKKKKREITTQKVQFGSISLQPPWLINRN